MKKTFGILEELVLFSANWEAHTKRVEDELHVMSLSNFLFWSGSTQIDAITRSKELCRMLEKLCSVQQ